MRRKRAAAPEALENCKLEHLGAPVEVRRHPKARRMTLRVSRTRKAVLMTLPLDCDLTEANTFLDRNIEWVRERLGNVPEPVPFADGAFVPLRGVPHKIRFDDRSAQRRPVLAMVDEGRCRVLSVAGHIGCGPRRLRDWMFAQARDDLDQRVLHHARYLGVRPKRINVRDQVSRWGSCSTTGALSFSWRLVMAPPLVLDYVAAHEVAHLRQMNHGPKFWALVRETMPRMDEAVEWLDDRGMDLHRYGVALD